jgi:hypothetical protein
MQEALFKRRIALTKKQIKDIDQFKADLAKGNVSLAFEGSLLEGMAFLQGAKDIVEAFNH